MPSHSHDEAHLVLLFDGAIESTSGGKTSIASASDLLFVPEGETHTSRYHDRVHGFYVRFRPSWWERVRQSSAVFEATGQYRECPPSQLAMRLYREFRQRDNLTPLMLEGLTLELLVAMSRQESEATGRGIPRWLQQVQDLLRARFTEGLSIETLASEAGVHPGHLMRSFRRHYHCSIGDYLRALRVEHACRVLSDEDEEQPLSQIAVSLGFADQSHFCKTFKKLTGTSPTEFRNRGGGVRPRPKLLP